MMLNPFIIVCFFVSYGLGAMEQKKEDYSPDFFASITTLICINNAEINKNKSREYWLDKVHKAVSSSVFIAPYAALYYGSAFYPEYIEIIKFCFPPFTLFTYYLTLNENYKKTTIHSNIIAEEIEPLRDLLPNIRRLLEYTQQDEREQELLVKYSRLVRHLKKLEQENQPVYKFFIDVLIKGAQKYQNNQDMMGQTIGGSLELRLVIIFSFLKLIEGSDNNFLFFTDSKPSISIAAFDWWRVTLHSYSTLVNKIADELNNNLSLIKDSPEKLKSLTNKTLLKTIVSLLAQLNHTEK